MKRPRHFVGCLLLTSLFSVGAAWSAVPAQGDSQKTVSKTTQKKVSKAKRSVSKKAAKKSAKKSGPTVAKTVPVAVGATLAAPVALAVAAPTPVEPAAQPSHAATAAPEMVAQVTAPAATNPYLAYRTQAPAPAQQQTAAPAYRPNNVLSELKSWLPSLPTEGQAILPVIKTVYPTGEKPLVVLTFKCPTELVGITPIPTKALHGLVDAGMNAVNRSNLLSFNMQQVCQ